MDGRGLRDRVRRPGNRRAMLTDLSPLHPPAPGPAHRRCWCTVSRTPTSRWANRSARTPRCVAAGVPTDLLLLPGEGHTIVGHDGRISSTRSIVEWHTRWLRDRHRPGGQGAASARPPVILDGYPAGPLDEAVTPDGLVRAGYRDIIAALEITGIDKLRAAATELDRIRVTEGISFIADVDGELRGATLSARSRPARAVRRGLGDHQCGIAAANTCAERLSRRRLRRGANRPGRGDLGGGGAATAPGSCRPRATSRRAGGRGPPSSGSTCCMPPSGEWVVLEDNLRVPSGLGYAVANRRTAAAALPMLHPWPSLPAARPPSLPRPWSGALLEALSAAAPPRCGGPPRRWPCCPTGRTTPRGTSTACWPTRWPFP